MIGHQADLSADLNPVEFWCQLCRLFVGCKWSRNWYVSFLLLLFLLQYTFCIYLHSLGDRVTDPSDFQVALLKSKSSLHPKTLPVSEPPSQTLPTSTLHSTCQVVLNNVLLVLT